MKRYLWFCLTQILLAVPAWSQEIRGTVYDDQGHPVTGAVIYAVENNTRFLVDNDEVSMPEKFLRVLSDRNGVFSFPKLKRPIRFLIARDIDDRFAWMTDPAQGSNNKIIIREPARIVGQLLRGKSPIAQKEITAILITETCRFSFRAAVQTNQQGRFVFENLPAGRYRLQTIDPMPQVGCCFRNIPAHEVEVILQPSQSLKLQIGGSDLPWLCGKITDIPGEPLHGVWVYLTSNTMKSVGIGSWSDVTLKDGTFAIYDIPPGDYILHCFRRLALNNSSRTLQTTQPLTITDRLKPNSPALPLFKNVRNISINLEPFMPLEIDKPIPPLKSRTLTGEDFDIEKERGKIVVIHFYASWCLPCVNDFPNYDKLVARFDASQLRVVGINLDETLDDCRSFLKKQSTLHAQLFAGPWTGSWAVKDFHIADVPSTIIVGHDGRIIQRDLFGDVLEAFIDKNLSRSQRR